MPCMATRFPYNTKLTAEKIETVKKGENILKNIGFFPVRLRLYNDLARIETEKNKFNEFILNKETIIKELKKLGIKYITLDIEGLRSGSMDL